MELKSVLHLLYLTSMQKKIKLQAWNKFPSPWIVFKNDGLEMFERLYGSINYREILHNEIVIDVDGDSISPSVKHADLVQKDLDNKRVYYSRWLSGGDGIHFHLLFEPKVMLFLTNRYGYNKVKESILNHFISPKNIKPKKIDSHICFGVNKLICLEHSKHKKGNYKTLIVDMFSKKYNEFPEELIIQLESNKIKQIEGKKRYAEIRKNNPKYSLPCYDFILGKDENQAVFKLSDGLYRLTYIYVSLLVKDGLPPEKIFESTVIWKNKFNKKLLQISSNTVTNKIIKYMIKTCRGEVSCNFISSAFSEIGASEVCKNCILRGENG